MDILTMEKLTDLLEISTDYCVSIYLPTHRTGREQQQDPVRLKNLLEQAKEQLTEVGMRHPDIQVLLQPAEDLLQESDFWQHQSDGLAILLAQDFHQIYRLPRSFPELLVVSNYMHIKPLLPVVSGEGDFYLLALSLNHVRLYHGTQYTISEIELIDIPTSLEAALRYDDPEKHLDFHTSTGTPGRSGERAAAFHGRSAMEDEEKVRILRFFHILDNRLGDVLENNQTPLILAAVDYLHPIYHQANSYPFLLEEGMMGNPDDLRAEELQREAWKIAAPHFAENPDHAIGRYQHLSTHEPHLVSAEINEVIKHAYYGQVETLFVSLGIQKWGRFNPDLDMAEVFPAYQPPAQDLLDLSANYTLRGSGKVFALEADQLPGESGVAAIFRYSHPKS